LNMSSKTLLLALYRSLFLRILLILLIVICLAYYALVLPWLNRAVSENYQKQTGHSFQHDKLHVQLFKCNINLNHLKDSADLWQAESLHVNVACWQSLRERSLVINEIAIQKLIAKPRQDENGQWSFADILQHQDKITNKSGSEKSTSTPVLIKKITIANSAVESNVSVLNNMPLIAAPLNFTLSNIDLRTQNPAGFTLKVDLNKAAQVLISGKLNLESLTGEVDIDARNIPFQWFNSALQPYVALEVLKGSIDFQNHVTFAQGLPQKIISSGKLIDLKVRPTSMEQDAVKWKSLTWENAEITFAEKSIHAPLVTLDELDGQFIIDKNRKTNIQAMILVPIPATNTGVTPAPIKTTESTPLATADNSSTPWQFVIDRLAVNNAAVGFYDQSLTPSFTVIVQQFTGDIVNISSDENSTAVINLAGNVDGYAPVTLKGKGNLFRKIPKLTALFSFKGMDMGALSPYSAEYAGWRINKGLLSADLHYRYEEGKILGKNHVVIDHLEFGEKVRGTRMIDIPLRLGLALLTDENGIAILDTEIAGTPNDPEFKIRDVIVRALTNTLKKIVTSPFKFLSNLLNSKEDLGSIEFAAGEFQLTDTAKEKLRLLTDAMKKRPKMRLSVKGIYNEVTDVAALKEEQVKSALQKSALQKSGLDINALTSHNELWAAAVDTQYREKALADTSLNAEQKYQALIAAEVVDPERLHKLAHERAQVVKQHFMLQLNVANETVLLNSERCGKTESCSSSAAVFTLEI
jgi:hypothetical protein